MKVSLSAALAQTAAEARVRVVARAPVVATHAARAPADRDNAPVARAQVAAVVHAPIAVHARAATVARVQAAREAQVAPAVSNVPMTAVHGAMIVDSAAMIAGTIFHRSSPRPCVLIFCRSRRQ
jgi:hypothetical protein